MAGGSRFGSEEVQAGIFALVALSSRREIFALSTPFPEPNRRRGGHLSLQFSPHVPVPRFKLRSTRAKVVL